MRRVKTRRKDCKQKRIKQRDKRSSRATAHLTNRQRGFNISTKGIPKAETK